MEQRNSHNLVDSEKVVGTNVYDRSGNHIGSVESLVLEKFGGRVSYAVISFGGFLGIGDEHYPVPWESLDYDEELEGFRLDVNEDQVKGAPRYDPQTDFDWSPESGRRIYEHYGIRPYWA